MVLLAATCRCGLLPGTSQAFPAFELQAKFGLTNSLCISSSRRLNRMAGCLFIVLIRQLQLERPGLLGLRLPKHGKPRAHL